MVVDRLQYYLGSCGHISEKQAGFKRSYKTTEQIVRFNQNIKDDFQKKQSTWLFLFILNRPLTGTEGAVAEWYRYLIVACLVTSSNPVPLKTRRVGQRCTPNLSRAETSSRWCGVVVRRGGASLGVVHVT
ncbi:uncharacterized protein TNCV_215301 [Trichonephila clavipes]|nr:uncharacterized protein TNCV_215301 [Trichonephila clavipes]